MEEIRGNLVAINPEHFPWNRLGMAEADWKALALAFYELAHNDFRKFEGLPKHLQNHPIGKICSDYIESKDYAFVEEAGRELTGTKDWDVFLGRSF